MTSSFVGYFFVPGPLGVLKRVPEDVFGYAESIGTYSMKIFVGVQKSNFSSRGVGAIGPILTNFDQILKSTFFTRLSL